MSDSENYDSPEAIAIVGMSGRFPSAKNISEFWENLREGVESISFFSREELEAAGRSPALLNHPGFVNAGGVLGEIELFDAPFFGFNPREAEAIDPQQRLFMECAWQALEDAGYDPETFDGSIGVYAGTNSSTYLFNLLANPDLIALIGGFQVMIGNDNDYLTTHVSYKLNLKGPSVVVQTACSTSLVAVCMACQSLLDHQCDMALAGGVGIRIPQKSGYLYQEGMVNSPDGHCRTFDAKAKGTVGGNGLGIVVLKRLADAVADRDNIHAIIKGSAINNDGALKVGYTAPSVEGQAEVIAMAQTMAEVDPETITYVEAHGTATPLGDPIEIAALTQAFRAGTQKKNFCGIGSVKSNIGHLNSAAGVAGLIKTILMLKNKMLPPTLHFQQPNPGIDFGSSPFYVNAKLAPWQTGATPRRAGVSSFGIGGTNAHVILEEAGAGAPPGPSRPAQLIVLSAKTNTALESAAANLVQHLEQNPDENLADLAHTCQVGRRAFSHRLILVCQGSGDAKSALSKLDPKRVLTAQVAPEKPVVFMFPGQGAQYLDMGRELYQCEPTFRGQVDLCADLLRPILGLDLRDLLYPSPEQAAEGTDKLTQTAFAQPALFVIEYALAQLWMEWGVHPKAMIGHSIGEYVAACLAGVFSLEDALRLLASRGRLMQQMPSGSMLTVPLPEQEVRAFLNGELDLAAVNSGSLCVVSGPTEGVSQLETRLSEQGLNSRRLHTSHAFHSRMMDPLLEPFIKLLRNVRLRPPQIPFASNLSGTWITAEAATDPEYWAKHLRQTVRFADGLREILQGPESILLEVGPGESLGTLARQHPDKPAAQVIVSSVRRPEARQSDVAVLLQALGRLWLAGTPVDWSGFYKHERRRRVSLPTYPFERQRYWVERGQPVVTVGASQKRPDVAEWFYVPTWKRKMLAPGRPDDASGSRWLVFSDAGGCGSQLIERLQQLDQEVFVVTAGEVFARHGDHQYSINPREPGDYQVLIESLHDVPSKILHLWSATTELLQTEADPFANPFDGQALSFYSLLHLAQALGARNVDKRLQIAVISNSLHLVNGDETPRPDQATLLGPCRVIPQEFPNISCFNLDLVFPTPGERLDERLLDQFIGEFTAESVDPVVAYRKGQRWVQVFEQTRLEKATARPPLLRAGGVYLITGGTGGIGLALSEYLARTTQAKLVLVGRTPLPEGSARREWLETHEKDDSVSRKILSVQTIEALGSEVVVVAADVTNQDQMQQVVDQTRARFGAIHGVIHAAGVPGGGIIQLKTQEAAGAVLAPKVRGTMVLDAIFKDVPLDFLVLCSSVAALLGGFGQVDYCGANAFLDAFATARSGGSDGRLVISINWDAWQEVGMAVNTAVPAGLAARRAASLKQGILVEEGTDVFNRVLNTTLSQVAVSTIDFPTRLRNSRAIAASPSEPRQSISISQPVHARPQLGTSYAPPRNETEQTIVEIWRQLLGVDRVGIYDNFFELGGHSLLAVRLMSEIEKACGQRIPLVSLFQDATVEALAEILRKKVDTLDWPTLVEIQGAGSKPPLFCVSIPNVNALGYVALARHLGANQPVYGLQAQYPEDLEGEHSQKAVNELATEYLQAMRAQQPHGPYQFAGMCRGAHIAFEMARRLEHDGEQVALVGILDTWVLENTYNKFLYVEYYARRLKQSLRLGPGDHFQWLKKKIRGKEAEQAVGTTASTGNNSIKRLANPMPAYFPGPDFKPKTYSGRVSVFRARKQPLNRIRDKELGWGKLAEGGVDLHYVVGKHGISVLREPHVKVLAEELKKCLL